MQIYVVDDERGVLDLVVMILESHGYRVRSTLDPRDLAAWVIIDGGQPRLVISDFLMGCINGGELAIELRAHGYANPFLLLTGESFSHPPAHVDAVLGKPIKIDDLLTTVARLLAEKRV